MEYAQYVLSQKILGPGVSYVYPGHPVTIAMFIMHAFPSLDAAKSKERGDGSPLEHYAALCSGSIPGAGGNVYSALAMLDRIKSGEVTVPEAVEYADESWGRCDNQKVKDPLHYQEGVAEAAKLAPAFRALVAEWILK